METRNVCFGQTQYLVLALSILLATSVVQDVKAEPDEKVFMCYWGSWSVTRPSPYTFDTSHIDASMCTHLIYSFAGLNKVTNRIRTLDPEFELSCEQCQVSGGTDRGECRPPSEFDPGPQCGRCLPAGAPEPGLIEKTVKLKERNPNLKVMVAIGGWCEGSERYSIMASDPDLRAGFVSSVVSFLDLHNFDGLDLDWEYPGCGGANCGNETTDPENYVTLVKELRTAFDLAQSGTDRYLYLTAAVAASIYRANQSYHISELTKYLDYFNLMAYDFKMFLASNPYVGHHSPLYYKEEESEDDKILTVSSAVQYYLQQGADPKKLVVGIGAYGKTYYLKNPTDSFYDEALGPGPQGVGQEHGTIFYNEICERSSEFTYYFDYGYFIPYAKRERDSLWIGYDDEISVMEKVDYAEKYGLGGMMIWSIDQDDFRNACGGWYPFAIGNTIKQRMAYHANAERRVQ